MKPIGWLAIAALPLSVWACSGSAGAPTGPFGPNLSGSSGVDRGQVAGPHHDDRDAADLDDREDNDRDGAAEHEDADVHGGAQEGDDDAAPGHDDRADADDGRDHGRH
jgi:hypothetical protein